MRRYHRNFSLYYLAAMKLNQGAVNQGAAAGALVVVMKLIAYLLGVAAYMSTTVAIGSMVFVIAGMCIACVGERKREGGLSFKGAFRIAWIAACVSSLLVLIRNNAQIGDAMARGGHNFAKLFHSATVEAPTERNASTQT